MHKSLLIEIGVEELPAIPFLNELPNIRTKWEQILNENKLYSEFDFFYTPRRLVLWHENFLIKQENFFEEFFGAPIKDAYKDGEPTQAALGFAKKYETEVENLKSIQKGDKTVLYYKKDIKGESSVNLIGDMISVFLKSLNFGKSMRWGSHKESFIRPIRWISAILDKEVVDFECYGVKSGAYTYIHRSLTYNKSTYESAEQYFEELEKGSVILSQQKRREKIIYQIEALEAIGDIKVERDEKLLDEIVAITEFPTVLMGQFDKSYLELPPEVVITSMKENQRYFPVFDYDNKLNNNFVVVSNATSVDYISIIKGNEKVLHARLSDALFFFENDLKIGLQTEGLKSIVYLNKLGSLYDKSIREERICAYLATVNFDILDKEREKLTDKEFLKLLSRAALLAKADLLTEMVSEFPELQGVMGSYYATAANEDKRVSIALKEQYLPNSEDSLFPSTAFSSMVALSNKIDSLMALFSIGIVPSGTKDPYALRRAVNGIIKIVLKHQLNFNIKDIFDELSALYIPFDMLPLEEFFLERMYQLFDVNPSIVTAVIESKERNLVQFAKKVEVLKKMTKEENFKEVFSTFKRVANIVKEINCDSVLNVHEVLLQEPQERALHDAFMRVSSKKHESVEDNLRALFSLKPEIDLFFNNVMVNVDDIKVRQNRQNLVASIYKAFKKIADIKEISI